MQVHVYYGDGKGKTTAALGQALRSGGRGWKVLIVQFLKDADASSGEAEAVKRDPASWRLLRSRLPVPAIRRPKSRAEKEALRKVTRQLLEEALGEISSGGYGTVVLDEILAAWKLGLLRVEDIRRAETAAAAAGVRLLVLTGRWAPKTVLGKADLVTEMRKVRHPYDRGRKAERGIDF